MNLALEYASVTTISGEHRYPVWIANGPAAVELDLWGIVGDAQESRLLCEVLLRHAARLLVADVSPFPFVPRVEESGSPWQVGLRLEAITRVEAFEPNARQEERPGESVVVGDPAFRIVLLSERDSATLRTDRAGVEALARACRSARTAAQGRS